MEGCWLKPLMFLFVCISEHMFFYLLLCFCVFFMWQDVFMASVFLYLLFPEREAIWSYLGPEVCRHILQGLISLRALDFELGDRQLTWARPHATLETSSPGRMLKGGCITSGSYMALHLAGTSVPHLSLQGLSGRSLKGLQGSQSSMLSQWSLQKGFQICAISGLFLWFLCKTHWQFGRWRGMHVLGPSASFLPALPSYLTVLALSLSFSQESTSLSSTELHLPYYTAVLIVLNQALDFVALSFACAHVQ